MAWFSSVGFFTSDFLTYRSAVLLFSLLLLLFIAYQRSSAVFNEELVARKSLGLACTMLFVLGLCCLAETALFVSPSAGSFSFLSVLLQSNLLKAFIFWCAACFLFLARHVFLWQPAAAEVSLLVFLSLYAILGLLESDSLLLMVVYLELFSYVLFVFPLLFGYVRGSAVEASLRYFVVGGFSTLLLGIGVFFVYYSFGTISVRELLVLLEGSLGSVAGQPSWSFFAGFLLLYSGLAVKLAFVPFHYWLRGVYEGSPYLAVTFFSTLGKVPLFLFLLRLVQLMVVWFLAFGLTAFYLCFLFSALTAAVGILWGFYQTHIKSLLAITGLVNFAFIVAALHLGAGALLPLAVALANFIVYALSAIVSLVVLVQMDQSRGGALHITDAFRVASLPFYALVAFAFAIASLVGLPPFPGFFAKGFIYVTLVTLGHPWLAFSFMALSIANGLLYLRLLRFAFFSLVSLRDRLRFKGASLPKPLDFPAAFILLFSAILLFAFALLLPWGLWLVVVG